MLVQTSLGLRTIVQRLHIIPPAIWLSALWLAALFAISLAADLLTPTDALISNLRMRLHPPVLFGGAFDHILGTDQLGRDMLSRLIISIKTSMSIAFLGTVIGAVLGTTLGLVAGAVRGIADDFIMMLVDVQAALPFIIVAMASIAFFGNTFWLFVAVVGVFGWERYARIARGMTLAAREEGYAVATSHIGGGPVRVYVLHILPNIASALIVAFTLNFPETLLLETTLSFLGLGVQPPQTSLGTMLGEGREYLVNAWWIAVIPGVVVALASLSTSLIGDWLRDVLDPKIKGKR
ncbi:ABC transporter permease [Roseibium marinum]|uniref:Peptide/nickel transport system permease protein n=1 Tax=Roseibium marinum TaxID=281252 RepID=A0A2S3ULH0_9HYPH|nr:ABC transporter permease [Roseibium marinum]POF28319.1 peptide/nickel transport system permease protein [Roseibium marinum]